MMVIQLEDGYKVDGEVSLSPLVVIGPQSSPRLTRPAKLSLPLSGDGPLSVFASHTSCMEETNWERLNADTYTANNNVVEVNIDHYSLYQAQRGPRIVHVYGDYMHFSVSTKLDGRGGAFLQLRYSSEAEYTRAYLGDFRLAHSEDETEASAIKIRTLPLTKLDFELKALEECIMQCNSPFDIDPNNKVVQPLHEKFVVLTSQFSRKEMPPLKRQGENPKWLVKPNGDPATAAGTLTVSCLTYAQVEHGTNSSQTPYLQDRAVLEFSFSWKEEKVSASWIAGFSLKKHNGINANVKSKAEGKGKEEEGKGERRKGKGKGKLEVKLWQKRKNSQTRKLGIEPGTRANATDALPLSRILFAKFWSICIVLQRQV